MTCVGIDLGTTNSLVARWTSSGPELIPNAVGERLTPSVISIADDGSIQIGRAALDRLVTHPERSVAAFKRWMGTSNDAVLAGRTFRAEELSSLVLRSLKQDHGALHVRCEREPGGRAAAELERAGRDTDLPKRQQPH